MEKELKKYNVRIPVINVYAYIDVEAENEEAAEEISKKLISMEHFDFDEWDLDYRYTDIEEIKN